MRFEQFMQQVLSIFPNAEVGEDEDRQLVIFTGLMMDPDSEAAHIGEISEHEVIDMEYDDDERFRGPDEVEALIDNRQEKGQPRE